MSRDEDRRRREPRGGCREKVTQVLVVNSDPAEPAVPLDLSLTVRVTGSPCLIEIVPRVSKRQGYPADRFLERDLKVRIHLPTEAKLQEGSASWEGNLQGEETREYRAVIRVPLNVRGSIRVSAVGVGPGGRTDADTERFYFRGTDEGIRISAEPFDSRLLRPGTAEQPD